MAIGARTFQSAGQISQHYIPGAYSRIDSVKGSAGLASANRGVIMGQCTGGQPTTLLEFTSAADAQATLRSGPLFDAVRLAFNPGGGFVPQRLCAVRVNPAVQAFAYLKNGSSANLVKVSSRDYGLYTNQIKLTMANGTSYGKKITLDYQTEQQVLDNIRRISLTITHATATVTVVNNNTTHTMTLSVGTINIDLNTYNTIGDLAAYINAQSGYTAVVTAGEEAASSLLLDSVTAQSLLGGYAAQSTMQAIIDTINAQANRVLAEDVAAATNREIPANFTAAYLTSGAEGTYDATAWTNSLTMLESEDVQFISTPDSNSSYHAQIKSHCEAMSAINGRRERQFVVGTAYVGGTKTTPIANAISAAQTLNSKYGAYVFNGGSQYNVNGVVTNYGSGYVACMVMALKCALAINEPLTKKDLNLLGLEFKLSTTDLENLIRNGVLSVNYNESLVPSIVRQVNSYQTDDLKWNEFSMVSEMLFVSRDLRSYLEAMFIGKPGNQITLGVIRGAVESRLRLYTDMGLFTVSDDTGVAWWNVLVRISGDTIYIDYDANITAPINFQFITNHFHEVSSLAAAA